MLLSSIVPVLTIIKCLNREQVRIIPTFLKISTFALYAIYHCTYMLTKIKNEDLSVPSIIYLQHSFLKYVLGYLYTLTRSRNPILKNKKKQRQPSRRTNVTIIRNSNGCWTAKSIIRRINQDLVGGKKLKKQNQDAASPWNKIFRVSRRVHYRITRWSQKGAEKNSKN